MDYEKKEFAQEKILIETTKSGSANVEVNAQLKTVIYAIGQLLSVVEKESNLSREEVVKAVLETNEFMENENGK